MSAAPAIDDYFATINQAIADHPRSQQTRIGPSEMGIDCDQCLARKIAGVPEIRDATWLPTIGTAVHAWLEEVFSEAARAEASWLTEVTVTVGTIGDTPITGSVDLFDTDTGWVIDHKIVGDSTIKAAKGNGPSAQYRAQAHLYGKGMTASGVKVNEVAVAYLPRNAQSLTAAYVWHEPYDERVANAALLRCNNLHYRTLIEGLDALLPTLEAAAGCWSCSRYVSASGFAPLERKH